MGSMLMGSMPTAPFLPSYPLTLLPSYPTTLLPYHFVHLTLLTLLTLLGLRLGFEVRVSQINILVAVGGHQQSDCLVEIAAAQPDLACAGAA